MKDFFKFTLASIVGVVLAGIIFTVIGIVSLAGMAVSSESETTVQDNSIFVLKLNGMLEERSEENPFSQFMGDSYTSLGLDDILSSIQKAKNNDKIKGIFIKGSAMTSSFASLEEIRNALVDFKESGKFIISYADQYSQASYYLSSVSDKIILNPQGSIDWKGLAAEITFFKDVLAKLDVEMQVFKVGTYKSAVEPFIGTEMSPANRQQTSVFLNSIWQKILTDVSASRHISTDSLNLLADQIVSLKQANELVRCGLADTLLYEDETIQYLKQLTQCEEDDNLATHSLKEMVNVKRNVPKDKSGNVIAVYYAFGEISHPGVKSPGDKGIDPEEVVKDLRKLQKDESVKAVVFRVNSPGGSAYGSEQIWHEVVKLKEQKPVIVSMGDYAASGGYYISCAADYIVADPTTLTGSIGIFGMIPNVSKLLKEKIGLHFDGVKTNQASDMFSMSRPFNEAETAAMQKYINEGYELFVKRCADGRKMSTDAIKKIAEGRVWTGASAKELGLVDELGGLDKAIKVAEERAGVEAYSLLTYPEKKGFFSTLMDTSTDDVIHSQLKNSLGSYYQHIEFIQELEQKDHVQARIPFALNIN